MLGKVGLVAAAAIAAAAAFSVNLRETYNEMYPANTLRRDALGLCHEADRSFVRARQSDREGCYDSMPHDFAMAIGWLRRIGRVAQAEVNPGGFPTAEQLLAGAASVAQLAPKPPQRLADIGVLPATASVGCRSAPDVPSPASAPGAVGTGMVQRQNATGRDGHSPLTALGIVPPQDAAARMPRPGLLPPPLMAGTAVGADDPAAPGYPARSGSASPFDALPSPDLGDGPIPTITPLLPDRGCRTPA